jgi:hypothetical protein
MIVWGNAGNLGGPWYAVTDQVAGSGSEMKNQATGGHDMVVGFVHSSGEAGNDRGAKGRIQVRNVTVRQGHPRRGTR